MLRFALRQTLVTLMLMVPALAASPDEARGKTLRANTLRTVPLDRPGDQKPAQGSTAIPNPAYPLPGRNPRRGIRRGHLYRSSDDAGVRAQSRPDPRPAVVSEDPRIRPPQLRLQRLHGPGDHLLRNSAEGFVEGGDGRRRLDLVEPLTVFKQARRDDLSILVDNPRRQTDLGHRLENPSRSGNA